MDIYASTSFTWLVCSRAIEQNVNFRWNWKGQEHHFQIWWTPRATDQVCMRHNLLVLKVCLLKPIQKLDILKNICFLNHFNSMNGSLLIIYITRDMCPISPTDQRWLRYQAHQYAYHNSVIILERLFEYIFITDYI